MLDQVSRFLNKNKLKYIACQRIAFLSYRISREISRSGGVPKCKGLIKVLLDLCHGTLKSTLSKTAIEDCSKKANSYFPLGKEIFDVKYKSLVMTPNYVKFGDETLFTLEVLVELYTKILDRMTYQDPKEILQYCFFVAERFENFNFLSKDSLLKIFANIDLEPWDLENFIV